MGQDLPGPGNDGRCRRPSCPPRHHLRNECRELPSPRRPRTQARPWPPADPRDNLGQRLIVAARHPNPLLPLARQSHRDNYANAATPDFHPDCRWLPIQIAALHRTLAACYAHMGRLDEANATITRLRAIAPLHLSSDLPFRKPDDRELFTSGLRLAAGEAI